MHIRYHADGTYWTEDDRHMVAWANDGQEWYTGPSVTPARIAAAAQALCHQLGVIGTKSIPFHRLQSLVRDDKPVQDLARVLNQSRHGEDRTWFVDERGILDYHLTIPQPEEPPHAEATQPS